MNNHPIQPSIDLIKQWSNFQIPCESDILLANRAAQWGADQELKACCEWLESDRAYAFLGAPLYEYCRPKPLSLKEQALEQLINCELFHTIELSIIRQALKSLPDD